MHSILRVLLLAAALVVVPVIHALAQGGPPSGAGGQAGRPGAGEGRQQRRGDAREMAPEALIGTWVLNVSKSKYTGSTPPKSQIRNFDYSAEGKIICHIMTVGQNGNTSTFHWIVTLDGVEHPEYSRGSGSMVVAMVGIKKIDERRLGITTSRGGEMRQSGEWQLSEDGNTLTQILKNHQPNAQGVMVNHVAVFDRQK
jgi:hypothetical protein